MIKCEKLEKKKKLKKMRIKSKKNVIHLKVINFMEKKLINYFPNFVLKSTSIYVHVFLLRLAS